MDLYILCISFFSFSFHASYEYRIEEWTESPKIKRLPLLLSSVLSGPIYRIANSYTCDCAWDELHQIINLKECLWSCECYSMQTLMQFQKVMQCRRILREKIKKMYRMNCGANLLWQWANSCCLISASAVWVTNCQQKNCPVMHPYSVSCLLLLAPPMNSSKVHRYSFIARRRVWHSTCKRDILRTIHQLPVARQEEYT